MANKQLFMLALCLALVSAAPKSPTDRDKRIAALFVKDSDNGQLRFLGAGIGAGSGAGLAGNNRLNQMLNQYITQKQDLLEQLRPVTGSGITGTGVTGVTGTGVTGTGVTGIGGLGSNLPIVINLGAGNLNGVLGNALSGSSLNALLPQLLGSSVVGNGGTQNIVVGNRRRPVLNGGQVYVLRPRRK